MNKIVVLYSYFIIEGYVRKSRLLDDDNGNVDQPGLTHQYLFLFYTIPVWI